MKLGITLLGLLSSQAIRVDKEQLKVMKQLNEFKLGQELMASLQIQLDQEEPNTSGDDNVRAIDRIVQLLKEVQSSIEERLSSQQEQLGGFNTQCLSQVPGWKSSLKETNQRLQSNMMKLPSVESLQFQLNNKINQLNKTSKFASEQIESLQDENKRSQGKFNQEKNEAESYISDLQRAKQSMKKVDTPSFLQDRETEQINLKGLSAYSKLFNQALNQLTDPKVHSDQKFVDKILEIIDNIISFQAQLVVDLNEREESRQELINKKLENFKNQIHQLQGKLEEVKQQLILQDEKHSMLKESISGDQENKTQLEKNIGKKEFNCKQQAKSYQDTIDSFDKILVLIQQLLTILEHSSISQIKATVKEVMSGQFYNEETGNVPS